jgi:hypothetical protein
MSGSTGPPEDAPLPPPSGETPSGRGRDRRLVSTIVCAYSRNELPASWVQVFRRFERAAARSGLRLRARLVPLEELPERFEVLVVAPELEHRAEALRTGARIVCTTRQGAPEAVEELLRELRQGDSIYAEPARPDEPRIITHRGSDVL